MARIERPKMRDMAMLRLNLGIVLYPFLQLPTRPDLKRRQAYMRRNYLAAHLKVALQQSRRAFKCAEQSTYQLDVHGCGISQLCLLTALQIAVFGREGWVGDKLSCKSCSGWC